MEHPAATDHLDRDQLREDGKDKGSSHVQEDSQEPGPDTLMCARCHGKLNERNRCGSDNHNWYTMAERAVTYRDVLAGVPKVVD